MADDDEIMEPGDLPEEEPEEDLEGPEIDEADLEEGDELEDLLTDDDEDVFVEIDDDTAVEEEEEDADPAAGPVRKTVPTTEDEDEDEDLLAPDDVEADLDMILKDRMVAAEDEVNEDEEEPEDRAEPGDRLQPKRADEQLCPSCFLLVRHNAPICPVGDDDCPLFS
jgi:hypothetical protein